MKKRSFGHFLRENSKIIIPIAIIGVPAIIFAIILIVASFKSNTVIVGHRYRNDLNPEITEVDIETIQSNIDALPYVETAEISLKTSQFRVLIDASNSITDENAESLCKGIYEKINSTLPISIYFSKGSQGQKMYDLEITVYNDLNYDSNLIIYNLVKNSTMDSYEISNPSNAKDPDLVEELLLKEEERKNPSVTAPETTPQFTEELEDEDIVESVE